MAARKKQSEDKASPPSKSKKKSAPPKKTGSSDNNKQDLVIVESPSKAKTINKYLGSSYKVLASSGHIRDLPKGRKKAGEILRGVSKDWVPTYVLIEEGRKTKVIADLKREVAKSNRIYLATDPDREGEAIAWHLKEVLELDEDRTFRITFNEITKTAVQNALENAGRIDMDRVRAQEARRILDRAVGFPLSSLMGKKVKPKSSAGRVQSVALRLVVDREREIEAFETNEYWKITALLALKDTLKLDPKAFSILKAKSQTEDEEEEESDDSSKKKGGKKKKASIFGDIPEGAFSAELAQWNGGKVEVGFEPMSSEERTSQVAAILDKAAYQITKVEQKDRNERPQPPFTTSTLQQQASTRLRFSTSRTMTVAQKLYQGVELGREGSIALITYMRTDSTRISNDAMKTVRSHIESEHGQPYLPEKPNNYASGKSAQEAHEAIRPTDLSWSPERAEASGLKGDDLRLYTLIYNRFVASQMTPAVFAVTNIEVTATGEKQKDGTIPVGLFKAQGKILKFDGYRKVMAPSKQEDTVLPPLEENQDLDRLDSIASQHFTQPPPRYNEASLVKALEKEGIGRPSTYATIISKITDEERGYVKVENRRFFATDIGKAVTDALVTWFPDIMDLKFTSKMEDDLDTIETGKTEHVELLKEFWGPFSETLKTAEEKMPTKSGEPIGENCPECGHELVRQFNRRSGEEFIGCSNWKEGDCGYIRTKDGEVKTRKRELTDIDCPACKNKMVENSSDEGSYLTCSNSDCKTKMTYDAEGNPVVVAQSTEYECKQCGKPMILREGKSGKFLGCSGYPKCKSTQQVDKDGKPIEEEDLGINCEKCGSPMKIRTSFRGPFFGCSGYPKCKSTKKMTDEDKEKFKHLLPEQKEKKEDPTIDIDCPECGTRPMRLKAFRGRQFLGCTKYPDCKGTRKATPELLEESSESASSS